MKSDRMTIHEIAKRLGKSPMWVVDELRRDSKREVKQWPFATSTQSETGRWNYVILRTQFNKWEAGDMLLLDYTRLADMIADRLMTKLEQNGSML